MENSICFLHLLFESFPKLLLLLKRPGLRKLKLSRSKYQKNMDFLSIYYWLKFLGNSKTFLFFPLKDQEYNKTRQKVLKVAKIKGANYGYKDEGWWRMMKKDEEGWRIMISSCWGGFDGQMDRLRDGRTFVIVESLSWLKIVEGGQKEKNKQQRCLRIRA